MEWLTSATMENISMRSDLTRVSEHLSPDYTAAQALKEVEARLNELAPRLAELTSVSPEHAKLSRIDQAVRYERQNLLLGESEALKREQGKLRHLLELEASAAKHKELHPSDAKVQEHAIHEAGRAALAEKAFK